MPQELTISAQTRQIMGKPVRHLRAQGITPANLSGGQKPSQALQLSAQELTHLTKHHGARLLRIRINPGSKTESALVNKVDRNPITGQILHVDFRRVSLRQPIRVRVPIHVTGEAPAVRVQGGVLLHLLDTVEVEALPADVPEAVDIDISTLDDLNSLLTVAHLALPPKVVALTSADEPVVTVKPSRVEVAPPVEAGAVVEVPAAPEEVVAEKEEQEETGAQPVS